ncbi:MAG: sulfate ABC transporter permease subunit CysT [Deltaproteobacteria bacterium]|nr:sulfate ABC transporter permease subunit CysT [Deltaproteobacteria bacterium]
MNARHKQGRILPGFNITFGITVLYLSLMVILPLSMIVLHLASGDTQAALTSLISPRVLHALRLSFSLSLVAAFTNVIFGLLLAWILVRYRFPGRRLIDGVVDLPFALPTAVAGIALTTLYAPNGWLGSLLSLWGIKAAFTPLGIYVALIFVGLPFVVRSVQPVLEDFDSEVEEASLSLGAGRVRTFFAVILPVLWPSLLAGFSMAFARGLGEYGSVVFISGNMPMKTEIVPLLIMNRLEQFDYMGATSLGLLMLVVSFALMFVANVLQARLGERAAGVR